MKIKILLLLCLLCLVSGCKVELPAQHDDSSTSLISSTISSEPSSVFPEGSVPSSSAAALSKNSAPVSSAKEETAPEIEESACSFSISAADIIKNKDRFSENQLSSVPKDGMIYSNSKVELKDGDTVFDVLIRVTKADKISVTHSMSAFQTEYVQSIGGIQEKQYGAASGWTFLVNGKQPPVACNSYKLKSGEQIEWVFFCGNP